MIVKTVSVSYGRKVNLGDFNSANVECTVWADIEPGDDLHSAMGALWDMAKANVKAQVVPLVARNPGSVNVSELFLGLPIEKQEE